MPLLRVAPAISTNAHWPALQVNGQPGKAAWETLGLEGCGSCFPGTHMMACHWEEELSASPHTGTLTPQGTPGCKKGHPGGEKEALTVPQFSCEGWKNETEELSPNSGQQQEVLGPAPLEKVGA